MLHWATAAAAAGLLASTGAQAASEGDAAVAAARTAAATWLAALDAGDGEGSWALSATMFRAAVSAAQWAQAARQVRTPLGTVQQRTERSAGFTRTLPGAPDGRYVLMQFATRFEHKAEAVETLTLTHDSDGSWRVAGYFVR
jgi:hypothetical protein